jgi:hypothetical protein
VTAEERLIEFKEDLPIFGSLDILHKYVYVGASVVLADGLHAALKTEVAEHFGVHVNDVVMVGSAKYGFSIKPDRRYGLFGNESDIDPRPCFPKLDLKRSCGFLVQRGV